MIVRKAERIDIECVVRGYLAGSAWSEYQRHGTIAGRRVISGLIESSRLPEPVFTPAVKADTGHDENISVDRLVDLVGSELARSLEVRALALYQAAHQHALDRGIIIADTKFEFGFVDGEITLIDELLTPDSSRFWNAKAYAPGRAQESFDKQFLRDWLNDQGWNREPPPPTLPANVIEGTRQRYAEALFRLTGREFPTSADTRQRCEERIDET
jgi:phosphoribosylaminoimidazole-succinocarboxamide synthase